MSRPLHATEHCRHFSYHAMDVDSSSGGPICAAGVDLTEPATNEKTLPVKRRTIGSSGLIPEPIETGRLCF